MYSTQLHSKVYSNSKIKMLTQCRPQPIMLKILPIMLLSSAQKIAHCALYYAHKY